MEKTTGEPLDNTKEKQPFKINKFVIGGALLLAAVVLLVSTSLQGNTQYYYTVEELVNGQAGRQNNIRISGVVLGNTIQYDPKTLTLSFSIAHIPADNAEIERLGGLAQVLHDTSTNPDAPRLDVLYHGTAPDLLKNEAQAILTGSMGSDGTFYADELLLKCPSRYEDNLPEQAQP